MLVIDSNQVIIVAIILIVGTLGSNYKANYNKIRNNDYNNYNLDFDRLWKILLDFKDLKNFIKFKMMLRQYTKILSKTTIIFYYFDR